MFEIADGMTSAVANAKVLFTGQIVLGPGQDSFRLNASAELILEVIFEPRASNPVAVKTETRDGVLRLSTNFGGPLGEVLSGRISTAPNPELKAGAWAYRYTMVAHTVGEKASPTRVVNITIAEARIA